MKWFFLSLVLLLSGFAFNQTITLEKYSLQLETHFKGKEFHYVDSLLHDSEIKIQLVKLIPVCDENRPCYAESIIMEDFNMERQIADSVDYFDSYFRGVKKELIDFSSAVNVEVSDYPFFLKQLLQPDIISDNRNSLICYEPRHAVLFINAQNDIVAVEEICFECGKTIIGIYANNLTDGTDEIFKPVFRRYGLLK